MQYAASHRTRRGMPARRAPGGPQLAPSPQQQPPPHQHRHRQRIPGRHAHPGDVLVLMREDCTVKTMRSCLDCGLNSPTSQHSSMQQRLYSLYCSRATACGGRFHVPSL